MASGAGGPLPAAAGAVSAALTARDLREPAAEDAPGDHERSQALLLQVLRHRGLRVGAAALAPYEDGANGEAHRQRRELTGRIHSRLRGLGIHGIRAFRSALHGLDVRHDGTCTILTLEGALAHMGIRLKDSELDRLLVLFGAAEPGSVDYVRLLAHGCSNWSAQREEVVREAFDTLSEGCPGSMLLHFTAIERRFHPEALTADPVPGLLEHHDSAKEFLAQWGSSVLGADGIVAWLDFADYYLDVSMFYDSDRDFCRYVSMSWGIDMDDWLAKKVFLQFASRHEDDTERALTETGFVAMVSELDPTISADEALVWFRAIDDDCSGEIPIDKFLSSKVLKAKRLFDEVHTQASRTATKKEILPILQTLNSAITDEEALAVYQYADLDGNGELSFAEVLENNVLRLLQIFDKFSRARNRCFTEADLKKLLQEQDPRLDDADIHQIYRAIDTDGSGKISFIEFCESHMLRAKMLFDRYDIEKSRALTKPSFQELLLDLDDSLTASQIEAIYNLVADQNTGKVPLGGFLNPNVVRIKLLFNKYDKDGSRYLDVNEFKAMLKDVFARATDRDIDALLREVVPPGQEAGISFTGYVQRFGQLSRRYDLIQLAKRREARSKAAARGLAFIES